MATEPAPNGSLLGQVLGGAYRIVRRLDEGGMGTVYAAEHVRLHRPVAVKVLAEHLVSDESALLRFRREAEIVSQLHHPHVVQVLDFDTTPSGEPYLVMEMLNGRALDSALARQGKLGVAAALRIALQAASGLAAAHAAGVVHRDLKPGNIFLVDAGDQIFVKLLDFGISKRSGEATRGRRLTGEFDILGTPDYMAPEQALGQTAALDHRGDQYALAVILFEMLTGQVPFIGKDVMELLHKVAYQKAPAPSSVRAGIPPEIDEVMDRALSKKPESRYETISAFAQALESCLPQRDSASTVAELRRSDPGKLLPGDLDGRPSQVAPLRPSLPPPGPRITPIENRRTSWHSHDPAQAIRDLIEQARQEVALDNLELALSCAESAIEIAQGAPEVVEAGALIRKNAKLFQRLFEQRLGNLKAPILVLASGVSALQLTPEQAFLMSRIEGGMSIEEAIDLSPLSREFTLAQLVGLVRGGYISIGR